MPAVIGQSAPAATTWVNLYTNSSSPAESATVTLHCCNRDTSADTVRIALSNSVASPIAPSNSEFVAYDASIAANTTETIPIVVPDGYSVLVYSGSGNVSFNALGYSETNS